MYVQSLLLVIVLLLSTVVRAGAEVVDDPRPLAKAIEVIQAKYGWVITYEDPRYVYENDIADVAEKFRKDLHRYEPGRAPKVLIPKGGQLDITPIVSIPPDQIDNPASVVQTLLDLHVASGNAGAFALKQTGEILHVIPSQVKDSRGQLVPQSSILDVLITFPEEERKIFHTVEAICKAVSEATQTTVWIGTVPVNQLIAHRSRQGATNETARDVLVRTLNAAGAKLSWRLLYDPGLKAYALNMRLVPNLASDSTEEPVSPNRPTVPDSSQPPKVRRRP